MLRKYKNIFVYSDVSLMRILVNLLLLTVYILIRKCRVIAPVNNYRMMLDLGTPGLSRTLFIYGKRELLDTFVVRQEIKGVMNVLDVGANIGYYALMEAEQLEDGKVYAFEPDPRNIELLRENIALNNHENRIKVFPYAASNKNERAKNFLLGERTNISGFIERGGETGSVEVECIKLDDLPYINEIDFIRMDIEGYECKVLEGARDFLTTTTRALKLLIEVHTEAYNETDMNFARHLRFLHEYSFSVKYLIVTGKGKRKLVENGYRVLREATERGRTRYLFENIPLEQTLTMLNNLCIRSLMLEKQA